MTRADVVTTHREDVGRVPRRRGAVNGTLLVLLGLLGALLPLIGPYLGLSYGTDRPWQFTADRLLLNILPGLLVALAGLGLIASKHSAGGVLWGWLAALGGAWFVLGPTISSMWNGGRPITGQPIADSPAGRGVIELIYHLGLGTLIVFLAAVALGRFTAGTGRVVAEVPEQYRALHDDDTRVTRERDVRPAPEGEVREDSLRGDTVRRDYLGGESLRGDVRSGDTLHDDDTRIARDDAGGKHRASTDMSRDDVYEQAARDETAVDEQHHRRGWLGLGGRR
ncbi:MULTISPECIES: hypothetical protein [Actinokineospora]|uniref:Uncharacterized protein n=1 Tax=Actinokineospora fastidiosa TaxID=1816 RepID=A0A918GSX8_9PSEU|nr:MULTISPECIES: hypothetical protein [Actinokineospora]UVS79078.1 hypothetical protein Actkin_02820 [Actinokineospora sp. UTMC 2448]GGS56408.1 hypothetical protein GCM10010171_59230 [Actinokineospora fastidiosa]